MMIKGNEDFSSKVVVVVAAVVVHHLHRQSRKTRRRRRRMSHSSGSRRISVQSRLSSNIQRETKQKKRRGIGQRKEGDGNFISFKKKTRGDTHKKKAQKS
jgi:hypothetical protein